MKKYITNTILLIVAGLFLHSCSEVSYQLYEDISRIQFGPVKSSLYSGSSQYADSVKSFTFAYVDQAKMTDTIYFDIYTMGNVSEQDRPFKLVQDQVDNLAEDVENAVADLHYVGFDNPIIAPEYTIKAGTSHSRVPVVLLRDESLLEKMVVLRFLVVPNEHFEMGQPNLNHRRLTFTDQLTVPSPWYTGFLGAYSEVKHRFLISVTNEKWDGDFIASLQADIHAQLYWTQRVKKALNEYNKENPKNPLTDENDNRVIFP